MRNKFIYIVLFVSFWQLQAQKMVIKKPVVDLWREPLVVNEKQSKSARRSLPKKTLDSQLLSGERVLITEKRDDGWFKVQALDQPGRSGGQWVYYYGWVSPDDCGTIVESFPQYNLIVSGLWANVYVDKKEIRQAPISTVSIGSQFKGCRVDDWWSIEMPGGKNGYVHSATVNEIAPDFVIDDSLRSRIVATAKLFDQSAYQLGARCGLYDRGIDCSALINLVFKVHGFRVPRNSRSQFALSNKIKPSELKPADLIFVKYPRGKKKHIVHHVLMYLGDGMLIEATGFEPNKVRVISFEEKFGVTLQNAFDGMFTKNGEQLFFSSFLSDENLCKQMRDGWFDPLSSTC